LTAHAVRRGRRRQRGFSLIELMVATLVTLVAMAIAAGLLVEARKLFAAAGREQRDPTVELAGAWIRSDVSSAYGYVHQPPWSDTTSGSLVLFLNSGGATRYHLDYERRQLIRTRVGPDDRVLSRRAVLSRIVDWQWSEPYDGLLLFELEYQRHTRPLVANAGRGLPRPEDPEVASDAFLVAARGLIRYGWW
jgi:prepilin-type N-terminal cleavage/methylation domain-containing protein